MPEFGAGVAPVDAHGEEVNGMARDDDKQERESYEDWPKTPWATEASARTWCAYVDAKNAVKDWLAR